MNESEARDFVERLGGMTVRARLDHSEKIARGILNYPDDPRRADAEKILECVEQARRALKRGWDVVGVMDNLRRLTDAANWKIIGTHVEESAKRRERFRHQVAEPRNLKARAEGSARRAEWQDAADEIWTRHPEWTASDVARRIAKDNGDNANTVRRKITRK